MSGWASIILAGGESRRMGKSKGLLQVNGEPLLKKLVDVVQPFVQQIIIVAREEEQEAIRVYLSNFNNLQVITDERRFKGRGPLAGIQAGMNQVSAAYYIVCACDLPCLNQSYIAGLKACVEDNEGFEAYIPVQSERFQPLAAVYQPLLTVLEDLLTNHELKWNSLLKRLDNYYLIGENQWRKWTRAADPFFNLNTPEDYNKIRSGCV